MTARLSKEEARAWLADQLDRGWKRSLALSAYRHTSRIVAHQLRRVDGVEAIEVFGGSEERCRPGVSDIDLLIFTREGATHAEELRLFETLRIRYGALKRLLPHLGEVHVTSRLRWRTLEKWEVAPLLWFSSRRCLWAKSEEPERASKIVSERARFSLAILHYASACRSIPALLAGSRYSLALFSKEIAKSIAYATRSHVEIRIAPGKAGVMERLTSAFHAVDECARRALAEPREKKEPEARPAPNSPDRVALEAKDQWIKRSFAQSDPVPRSLPLRFPTSLTAAEKWLHRYIDFVERGGSAHLNVVSDDAHACCRRGWAWDRPWESREEFEDGRARMLWQRLLFHAQALPTLSLRPSRTVRNVVVRHFCEEARALTGESSFALLEGLEREDAKFLPTALLARAAIEKRMHDRGWSFFDP